MYRYGFIGMGNMGKAILKGILKGEKAENIIFSSEKSENMKEISKKTGINEAEGADSAVRNRAVASSSEILVLAVKPQVLPKVCTEIKDFLTEGMTVVSLAAGVSLERLAELLGGDVKLVRVMPNTPASIGEGMTAICFGQNGDFTEKDKERSREMFRSCGEIAEVSEKQLDVIGVTAGSSPAFTYMYIDALADAGVKYGIKREEAQKIAAKAVMGAAAMVLQTGEHPEILKNKVCSPGGTTIEGVEALYEWGLKNAVMKACTACMEKNMRMSGK